MAHPLREPGRDPSERHATGISVAAFVLNPQAVCDAAGIDPLPVVRVAVGLCRLRRSAARKPRRGSCPIPGGKSDRWIAANPDVIAEREALTACVAGLRPLGRRLPPEVTPTLMPSAKPVGLDRVSRMQRRTVAVLQADHFLQITGSTSCRHAIRTLNTTHLHPHTIHMDGKGM